MHPHERIEAWRSCRALTLAVYKATRTWPKDETFGLISQVRRASVSAETNIAEGCAKRGPREFRRFLDISVGSLAEITSLLSLATELGYLSTTASAELDLVRERASKITWLLYKSMSQRS